MQIVFWALTGGGYVGGLVLAFFGSRRMLERIAQNTPHKRYTKRAGAIAGAIAVMPALFFATVIGGNLGGTVATIIVEPLTASEPSRQIAVAAGIGLGVMIVLSVLVVTFAISGAVFVKVYLAKADASG